MADKKSSKASKAKKSKKTTSKEKVVNTKNSVKKALKTEVNVPVPVPDNKVGEFLGKKRRVRAPKYLRDSFKELKKVSWPSRKDAFKLTFAVIVFTLAFTIFTTAWDWVFTNVVERVLL